MRPPSLFRFLLSATLLLLLAAPASAAMSLAGRPNRREFMAQVTAAFTKEDYDTLEATVVDLRARKDRFPDGTWTLSAFYDALELLVLPGEVLDQIGERLARWKAAQPRSVAERIVESNALRRQDLRKTVKALAGGADPETKARALLDEAEKLEPQPPADWYNAMLRLGMHEGWDRAEFDKLYERAVAAEPGYLSFYFNRAIYLQSYGANGEWENYALEAGRKGASGEGMGIYSRIAWSLGELPGDAFLLRYSTIQWPLMRDGFRELDRLWPSSEWNLNNFCRFACLFGDRDTARELFARIDDNWTSNWLSHAGFKSWAAWANEKASASATPPQRLLADRDPDSPEEYLPGWALHFTADSTGLFAGYGGGRLVRWNLAKGESDWKANLGENGGALNAIEISPDGHWLVAGTAARRRDPNVRGQMAVWDLQAEKLDAQPVRRLEAGVCGVHGIHFSADGQTLEAHGYNQVANVKGELRIWTLPDWKLIRHVDNWRFPYLGMALLTPDGSRLAYGASRVINVEETATGKPLLAPERADMVANFVRTLALSPDRKTLACGTGDSFENRDNPGEIAFFNTTDWTRYDVPYVTSAGGLAVLSYSPDGRWLLGGGYDGFLRVFDAQTGKVAVSWAPLPGAGKVEAVAFAPDGQHVAAVRDNDAVTVYAFVPPSAAGVAGSR